MRVCSRPPHLAPAACATRAQACPLTPPPPPHLNTHTLAQLPGPLDTNATPPTNDSLTLGLGLGLGIPLLVAACAAVWWFKLRQRGAYGSPLNEPMVAG